MKILSVIKRMYSKLVGRDTDTYQIDYTIPTLQAPVSYEQEDIDILTNLVEHYKNRCVELEDKLTYLNNNPLIKEITVQQFVMTEQVYRNFVRSFENPQVTAQTSPTQAAYFLGLRTVFDKLSELHVRAN